jgi:hypothetical protein
MAAIGSVWGPGTWGDDTWAAGTWGDAQEASDTVPWYRVDPVPVSDEAPAVAPVRISASSPTLATVRLPSAVKAVLP